MRIKVIKEEKSITSTWAGGSSRQYYIFPATASYAARDFAFRISTAISSSDIEVPYTKLEGITRHLIMLEGTAHVFHQGYYDIVMHPYTEIDVFNGGWVSSACGEVTDFNLMVAKDVYGKLSVLHKAGMVTAGGFCGTCHKRYNHLAFFCGCGSASFIFSTGEVLDISCGDLLFAENVRSGIQVDITLRNVKLIRVDICCL